MERTARSAATRSGSGRRRSYDQYCPVARALDAVGDRWTLLVVRELLAGPRRYTDLHADLPGVSTDVLAGRLRDMERDGLVARRRWEAPASGSAYELTARGRALLPVLTALAEWGGPELGERRDTDAARRHWWALPLYRALEGAGVRGVVDVHTEDGTFHLRLVDDPGPVDDAFRDAPVYGHGAAPGGADRTLTVDTDALVALARGQRDHSALERDGDVELTGSDPATGLTGIS